MTPAHVQKEMIEYYLSNDLISCSDVSRKFGGTRCTVFNILKRNNIKIRKDRSVMQQKFSINQSYFDIVNTEDKAYFLGFMYADGNVSKGTRHNNIEMTLQEKDFAILEKFKYYLDCNKPLIYKLSKKSNQSNSKKLLIHNKRLHENLIRLGCVPNKSKILKFPTEKQVPKHLIRHFIRGYFDGDGSIYRKDDRYVSIDVYSSLEFNFGIRNCISDELKINDIKIFPRKSNGCSFRLHGDNAKLFLDWIYKGATVFLQRKYKRYKEYYKNNEYGPIIELAC